MSTGTVKSQSIGVTLGGGMSNLYGARDLFDYSSVGSFKAAVSVDFKLRRDFLINWDIQYTRLGAQRKNNATDDRILHYGGFTVKAGRTFTADRIGLAIGPYLHFLTNPEVGSGKYAYKLNTWDTGLSTTIFYQHRIHRHVIRIGMEAGLGFVDLKNQSGKNYFAMLVATWYFGHNGESNLITPP